MIYLVLLNPALAERRLIHLAILHHWPEIPMGTVVHRSAALIPLGRTCACYSVLSAEFIKHRLEYLGQKTVEMSAHSAGAQCLSIVSRWEILSMDHEDYQSCNKVGGHMPGT